MIGFDFGTTNSGMARVDGGALVAYPIDPDNALNPAVCRTAIYITKRFDIFTGSRAIDRYFADNLGRPVKFQRVRVGEIEQTFAEIGTFMRDVEIDIDIYDPGRLFVSFKSALSERDYDGTTVNGYRFSLPDLIATYMMSLRYQLESLTGQPQTRVVLGRPVRFVGSAGESDDQLAQARLASAAHRAGFSDVYFQYEPVAAAYSYAVTIEQPQTAFVFDFGGGTLDTTVMRIERGGQTQLLGIGGIALGGDRIDAKLVASILPKHLGADDPTIRLPAFLYESLSDWRSTLELATSKNIEMLENAIRAQPSKRAIRGLLELISSNYIFKAFDEAQRVKRQLSTEYAATFNLDGREHLHISEFITRARFESLIRREVEAARACILETLADADVRADQIDAVVYTGGSSLIPAFQRLLSETFGAAKLVPISPLTSVTSGLGLSARYVDEGRIALPHYPRAAVLPATDAADPHAIRLRTIDAQLVAQYRTTQRADDTASHYAITSTPDGKIAVNAISDGARVDDGYHNADWAIRPALIPADGAALIISDSGRIQSFPSAYLYNFQRYDAAEFAAFWRLDAEDMEHLYAAQAWATEGYRSVVQVTTRGYARRIEYDEFAALLRASNALRLPPGKGGLIRAVVPCHRGDRIALAASDGRLAVLDADQLDGVYRAGVPVRKGAALIGARRLGSGDVLCGAATRGAFCVDGAALWAATHGGQDDIALVRAADSLRAIWRADEAAYCIADGRAMAIRVPDAATKLPVVKADMTPMPDGVIIA